MIMTRTERRLAEMSEQDTTASDLDEMENAR